VRDRLRHLGLRLARPERADGGRERTAGAEDAFDFGVVLAGRFGRRLRGVEVGFGQGEMIGQGETA